MNEQIQKLEDTFGGMWSEDGTGGYICSVDGVVTMKPTSRRIWHLKSSYNGVIVEAMAIRDDFMEAVDKIEKNLQINGIDMAKIIDGEAK